MTTSRLLFLFRLAIWILPVFLFAWILMQNFPLQGVAVVRSDLKKVDPNIFFSPHDRLLWYKDESGTPHNFLQAERNTLIFEFPFTPETITVELLAATTDQPEILLEVEPAFGFQRRLIPLYLEALEKLTWDSITDGEFTLFQRKPQYATIDDFFQSPPPDRNRIGLLYYTPTDRFVLPNAKAVEPFTLPSALRGSHTLYLYSDGEPFSMTLEKQDLNGTEGKDDLFVFVTHAGQNVYIGKIPDDGDAMSSGKPGTTQTLEIDLPNTGQGLYEVSLEGSEDIILTNLTTPHGRVMFKDHVFLAGGPAYGTRFVSQTLYSDATEITVDTPHAFATQTLRLNDEPQEIAKKSTVYTLEGKGAVQVLDVPKNDIHITAEGGFLSFSRDRLFSLRNGVMLGNSADIPFEDFDYLLARYRMVSGAGIPMRLQYSFPERSAKARDNVYSVSIILPQFTAARGMVELTQVQAIGERTPIALGELWEKFLRLIRDGN